MRVAAPVLELGCGTGRIAVPLGRAGVPVVGIDRSTPMLARARQRVRRGHACSGRCGSCGATSARCRSRPRRRSASSWRPTACCSRCLRERDLSATLQAVARVLRPGALFGIDLVADLPNWSEYRREIRLSGWRPGRRSHITLVESVRQDRKRGLTIFEQEYTERRGRAVESKRFDLAFRTVSVPQMLRRVERAGFRVQAVLGDYDGAPWDPRADVWLIVAERR